VRSHGLATNRLASLVGYLHCWNDFLLIDRRCQFQFASFTPAMKSSEEVNEESNQNILDLAASDECEYLISMYQLLQEYYHHLARRRHDGANGHDNEKVPSESKRKSSGRMIAVLIVLSWSHS
jgi:hypothetical protein